MDTSPPNIDAGRPGNPDSDYARMNLLVIMFLNKHSHRAGAQRCNCKTKYCASAYIQRCWRNLEAALKELAEAGRPQKDAFRSPERQGNHALAPDDGMSAPRIARQARDGESGSNFIHYCNSIAQKTPIRGQHSPGYPDAASDALRHRHHCKRGKPPKTKRSRSAAARSRRMISRNTSPAIRV